MVETFTARIERGAGIPSPARLPYFPEQAIEALKGTGAIVLAGAREPVAFFGYPGLPSKLAPEGCVVEVLGDSRGRRSWRARASCGRQSARRSRCPQRRASFLRGPAASSIR